MSNINCICELSSSVELSNCCRNWSLALGSGSAAKSPEGFLPVVSSSPKVVEHGLARSRECEEELGGCNTLPDHEFKFD